MTAHQSEAFRQAVQNRVFDLIHAALSEAYESEAVRLLIRGPSVSEAVHAISSEILGRIYEDDTTVDDSNEATCQLLREFCTVNRLDCNVDDLAAQAVASRLIRKEASHVTQ